MSTQRSFFRTYRKGRLFRGEQPKPGLRKAQYQRESLSSLAGVILDQLRQLADDLRLC